MANIFHHGYALIIGVGQCDYTAWSLPVSIKDAYALRAVLTDPMRCAYPDSDDHIHVLHDTTATRAGILEGLTWLAQRVVVDPMATAIVYYSGHGWLDTDNSYFLIPYDISPHNVRGSALAATRFTEAIHAIQAQRLLVIMDCCHAEGMATAKAGDAASMFPPGLTPAALPKVIVDNLTEGAGRAVFTSSRGKQRSWVRPDSTLSIYTYHLIEALSGAGSKPDDTIVRLSSLMAHLGQAVLASARALGQEQTPFFNTAAEDFAVALLLGGKGLAVNDQTRMTGIGTALPSLTQAIVNDMPNQGAQGMFYGPVTFNITNASPAPSTEISPTPPHARVPNRDEQIAQQHTHLAAERRRLADLLIQEAMRGSAEAPANIVSGIHEARITIRQIKHTLREWGIDVSDHIDDGS